MKKRSTWDAPLGYNPLVRALHQEERDAQARRVVIEVCQEAGADIPPHPKAHQPGDARLLRGIPLVGVYGGMGGAVDGTKPEQETIRRETQRERAAERAA